MGQILIRNLDDRVIARLKARAVRNRTSAEEEARRALSASLDLDRSDWVKRADAVREMNGPQRGPSSLELLRADRDRDADA